MKYFIGVDNGVTGSVGILDQDGQVMHYGPTPVRLCQNYVKRKENINRVVGSKLADILRPYSENCTLVIERPLVNPMRWKATVSAVRCDEATLIVLEMLGIPHEYVDSRQWQYGVGKVPGVLPKLVQPKKAPKGATAKEKKAAKAAMTAFKGQTKKLSLSTGQRLFPQVEFKGDADALLMAEWARRLNL